MFGVIDNDVVDVSNLQWQVFHGMSMVGVLKVESGAKCIADLNFDVNVIFFDEWLTSENVDCIFDQGWDVIVDGFDNFFMCYLVNDVSVWKDIFVVYGSIFCFDGQVTMFWPKLGFCYCCFYFELLFVYFVLSCVEVGVFGIFLGVIGIIQVIEVIKIVFGQGELFVGWLFIYELFKMQFCMLKFCKDPSCLVCGDEFIIIEYIDYNEFCVC